MVGTAIFCVWATLILNYKQIVGWSNHLVAPAWIWIYLLPFVAIGSMLDNPRKGLSITLALLLVPAVVIGLSVGVASLMELFSR